VGRASRPAHVPIALPTDPKTAVTVQLIAPLERGCRVQTPESKQKYPALPRRSESQTDFAFLGVARERWVVKMLNAMLRQLGYKSKPRPFSEFIDFKGTVKAAKAAGLSVGDYIDRKHVNGSRTPTDQTIDGMASLGVFDNPLDRICELGPGSGRYLERTIAKSHPRHYEVYETSAEWRDWLVGQHGIVSRKCNGVTLSETESGSLALVQAHKLFPGLPFLTTVSYLQEMARVVGNGGWVAFDIMTEACFSPEHLKAWFDASPWDWAWSPHLVARDFTVKLFADQGVSLVGSFAVPLYPAITECMVFRKT
jgi:hypothetical protein